MKDLILLLACTIGAMLIIRLIVYVVAKKCERKTKQMYSYEMNKPKLNGCKYVYFYNVKETKNGKYRLVSRSVPYKFKDNIMSNIDNNHIYFLSYKECDKEIGKIMMQESKGHTKIKKCITCGKYFILEKGELKFFKDHKLEIPSRCQSCRKCRNHKNNNYRGKKYGKRSF